MSETLLSPSEASAPAPTPSPEPAQPPTVLAILGALGCGALAWLVAFALFLVALLDLFRASIGGLASVPQAAVFFVIGVLMLTGAGVMAAGPGTPPRAWPAPPFRVAYLVPLLLLAWLLGWVFSRHLHPSRWGWAIAPLHALLLLGFSLLAVRFLLWPLAGVDLPSPRRRWAAWLGGMAAIVPVVLGEFLGLFALSGMLALALGERLQDLEGLLRSPVPQVVLRHLRPLLADSIVLWAILVFSSLVVPLVEEAFKPLALWALLRRGLTPLGGLVLGALAGAGFALVENALLFWDQDLWATQVLARGAITLWHTLFSALVGYGLAEAVQHRRWGRLAGAYLVAVLLHGGWNAISMLIALVKGLEAPLPSWLQNLTWALVPGVALAIGGLVALLFLEVRRLALDAASRPALQSFGGQNPPSAV